MPVKPPGVTKSPLKGVIQWNTTPKQVTPLRRHVELTPTSVDTNLVVSTFKKQCDRKGHFQSPELQNVIKALENYRGQPNDQTLNKLRASAYGWKDRLFGGAEFKNCGGDDLLSWIEVLWKDDETAKAQKEELKDGDIIFRYLPRGLNQRNPMHGLITVGQFYQQFTQWLNYKKGSSIGWSFMEIVHAGIYSKREEFDGVIEVDGGGLSRNQLDNRDHEIDLVVRCQDPRNAADVSKIASLVVAKGIEAPNGAEMLSEHQKQGKVRAIFIWGYPLEDLINMAVTPSRGGFINGPTYVALGKLARTYRGRGTAFQMTQRVVCSHFVHAVLWATVDPSVTVRAATLHEYDHIFKLSPSHLWRQFRKHEGVWAWLPASFVGMQQDGRLFRMPETEESFKSLAA